MCDKKVLLSLSIDFQRAFDTVRNDLFLFRKPSHYGVRGKIHDWFEENWTNGTQSTKLLSLVYVTSNSTCNIPRQRSRSNFVPTIYWRPSKHFLSMKAYYCRWLRFVCNWKDSWLTKLTLNLIPSINGASVTDKQLIMTKLSTCYSLTEQWQNASTIISPFQY